MIQRVTVEEIETLVLRANKIRQSGEVAFVEYLNSHSLKITPPRCSPHSREYRGFWESTHYAILGEAYDARRHEKYDFELSQLIEKPYSYTSQEPSIIANQMRDWANILEAIGLPAGSRILEMGAGWGNTSLLLAQSGLEVSVLDINPLYLQLINERSHRLGLHINTIESEFLDIVKIGERYDAILFYESFHHSIDHAKLLDALKDCLVPNGRICFAGEPIIENAPYPWGLNPAGEALFQMHCHGWMELIFDKTYFEQLIDSLGFTLQWRAFAQGTSVAIASL